LSAGASFRIVEDTHFAGLRALAGRVKAGVHSVSVGVPSDAKTPDGTSLADVLGWNEFGTKNEDDTVRIPERPALRRLDEARHVRDFIKLNARNLALVVQGRMTEQVALELLGTIAAAKVQQEITIGGFAPNAPSTIAKKGSSHPLIDTNQLRSRITWAITPGTTGPVTP
jgi:hypothetical protein